jgi:hypothetical protein
MDGSMLCRERDRQSILGAPDRRSEADAGQPPGERQALHEDGELGLPPPPQELAAVRAVARLRRRREVADDEPGDCEQEAEEGDPPRPAERHREDERDRERKPDDGD